MEQRDYLQREIEKMGAMLLAIIGKLRFVSQGQDSAREIEMVDSDLVEVTGLTLASLSDASPLDIEEALKKMNGYSEDNLELISDILAERASLLDGSESAKMRGRAILILEWIDKSGKTFSFSRQAKLNSLKALM